MGAICNHVLAGYQVYFARSLETLGEHLQGSASHHLLWCAPGMGKDAGGHCRKLNAATGPKAALATGRCVPGATGMPRPCKARHPVPGWTSKSGWRHAGAQEGAKALGFDQARILLSGAAPIAVENLQFFTSLDLLSWRGHGQSEDSGPTAISLPGFIPHRCRKPLPGVQVHIAEDGEILVKGPNVFMGYKGRPKPRPRPCRTTGCTAATWAASTKTASST